MQYSAYLPLPKWLFSPVSLC